MKAPSTAEWPIFVAKSLAADRKGYSRCEQYLANGETFRVTNAIRSR